MITRETPFLTEVIRGDIEGHSLVHVFGAGSVGTSLVPITASNSYPTPTTPVELEFVSSSSDDDAAGTGAKEITIVGLDANWLEVIQTIETDGTTPVILPTEIVRLTRWCVSKSGSYATESVGSHVGTLTLRVSGVGATWSTIGILPFPYGQSQIGVYTIPAGKTGYLLSKNVFTEAVLSSDVFFFQRTFANVVTAPFTGIMKLIEREIGVANGYALKPKSVKGPFVGPCDVGFMGKVSTGSGEISVEFELLLIDN